jgi:hypothetical protein
VSRHRSSVSHVFSPRIFLALLLGAAAIPPLPLWAQAAPQQPYRELVLTTGKSLVVNSAANIERIAVGYGDVAEARPA